MVGRCANTRFALLGSIQNIKKAESVSLPLDCMLKLLTIRSSFFILVIGLHAALNLSWNGYEGFLDFSFRTLRHGSILELWNRGTVQHGTRVSTQPIESTRVVDLSLGCARNGELSWDFSQNTFCRNTNMLPAYSLS